jgi:hypothetical protein
VAVGLGSRFGGRRGESQTTRSALRAAGRVALWILVAMLLVRGLASVVSGPERASHAAAESRSVDPATSAFAVRFVRAYLGGSSSESLTPLLAPGVRIPAPGSRSAKLAIEQAEVAGVERSRDGQTVVTVACELADARTLFVAVPIARASASEVAAAGVPAVVAGPAGVSGEVKPAQALAGSDASSIVELVDRFLPAYFSAASPGELAYLVAPGSVVVPPGNGLEFVSLASLKQFGESEGPRRDVLATARVRDSVSGDTFQFAYRLQLVRRGRWYVTDIAGALS